MPSALKQKRIADPLAVANGGTGSSTAAPPAVPTNLFFQFF